MPASWQRVLAALGVAWSLLTAGAALRATRALPADPMARLEREFQVLVTDLPTTGDIGYLERYEGGGAVEAVQMHYAAQYALAPRIVVSRTGPEFVIVASGTERPGGDPRLNGYTVVARTAAGHRVFRRLPR